MVMMPQHLAKRLGEIYTLWQSYLVWTYRTLIMSSNMLLAKHSYNLHMIFTDTCSMMVDFPPRGRGTPPLLA